jgi:hypothetical protein
MMPLTAVVLRRKCMRIRCAFASSQWFAFGVQTDGAILDVIAASASLGIPDRSRRGNR